MAFPIIPRRRSGTAGNPTTLELGELAVNTATGKLYLGADGGVTELAVPVAAGTTVTEYTGDGTTTAFAFSGYNGNADGGYLVSVGGIDQPPSKYSISATAGGTITFVEAPVAGELISIRAIVAGSGGGGDGNAIQIQGRDVASTAPTAGQVLAWSSANNRWQPTSLNGSVTFNTAGTHQWAVPAWVRWAYVNAAAGDGTNGTDGTNGAPGSNGVNAYFDSNTQSWLPPQVGANGADGVDGQDGVTGKSITLTAVSLLLAGGTAGAKGLKGFGGGGSGGGGAPYEIGGNGAAGNGDSPGLGGEGGGGSALGGAGGGGNATAGENGIAPGPGGAGGTGDLNGGNGGNGGSFGVHVAGGGGGGGGYNRSGGGGGGGSSGGSNTPGYYGTPGAGGTGTAGGIGGAGETFSGTVNFTSVANTTIDVVISEGTGNASITITW